MLRSLVLASLFAGGIAFAANQSAPAQGPAGGAATQTVGQEKPATAGARQERAPQRPDAEALEKGRVELNKILTAAGARANLPGRYDQFLLWTQTTGVRYDALEIHRSRILRPGEPWRTNDLTPRFVWADGGGLGYLLLELVTAADEQGALRPQFRREIGGGDTYWAEVEGTVFRDEKAATNPQPTFLGEYFFGLMPHSLALFEPSMLWLRNERVDGRTLAVYTLRLPAPFEADYGHWSHVFTISVDPATHRIEQMQFADPFEDGVTIVVQYTDWVQLDVPEAQRELWRAGLRAEIEALQETLGEDGVKRLVARVDEGDRLVPRSIVLPSRRVVFDQRGSREREFLSADFRFEELPEAAYEQPWQVERIFESPYRSDFFDPEHAGPPKEPVPASGVGGTGGG